MIEEIVNSINDTIAEQFQCVTGKNNIVNAYGLANTVQLIEEGTEKSYPAIIANDGECYYVFSDDKYPIGFYHRLISKTYGKAKGFGDSDIDIELCEIILIVWGFTNQIDMSALEVERQIIIPSIPKEAQLVSSNFDSLSVINSEFRNINYLNRPEEFVFSVKYKVQYKFKRKCALKINCK
jgi:hypothetical protein